MHHDLVGCSVCQFSHTLPLCWSQIKGKRQGCQNDNYLRGIGLMLLVSYPSLVSTPFPENPFIHLFSDPLQLFTAQTRLRVSSARKRLDKTMNPPGGDFLAQS